MSKPRLIIVSSVSDRLMIRSDALDESPLQVQQQQLQPLRCVSVRLASLLSKTSSLLLLPLPADKVLLRGVAFSGHNLAQRSI